MALHLIQCYSFKGDVSVNMYIYIQTPLRTNGANKSEQALDVLWIFGIKFPMCIKRETFPEIFLDV